jgi:fluoroquinolone resistance protein
MDFPKNKTDFFKETFSHIDLTNEVIKNKEFDSCIFDKCSFVECTFENCIFLDCRFSECVLSAIKPTNSSFSECHFKNSKVIGFDWTKAKNIRSLSFDTCQLNYSNFRFLKLPKLIVKKCVVHEVDFTETDLSEGNFEESDLMKTIFFKTNLTKVNFKKAINYSIDLQSNTLKKAQFSFPEALSLLTSLDIEVEY